MTHDTRGHDAGHEATRGPAALAVSVYGLMTAIAFLPVLRNPRGRIVGSNDLDDTTYLWALQWFVHTVGHGQNPFVTDAQFATTGGLNATSFTSIMFPAAVVAPVTAIAGPLASFNLIMVASPFLAATAAFFLVRRRASNPAAFLGGTVYGFSTFMAVQLLGHLNLVAATAMVPALLLVLDTPGVSGASRGSGVSGARWRLVVRGLLIGVLVAGFLYTSSELLLTSTIMGLLMVGVARLAGFDVHPVRWVRARQRQLVIAAVTAAVLAVPFGYFYLRGPEVYRGVHQPSGEYQIDAAQVIVPFDVNLFAPAGGITRDLSNKNTDAIARGEIEPYVVPWTGNEGEWAGYLGIPMLALVVLALARGRKTAAQQRLSALGVVVTVVCSLGTTLHVQGADTGVLLPWAVIDRMPFLRSALPARLVVFSFLAAAFLVASSFDSARAGPTRLRSVDAWTGRGNRVRLLAVVATIAILPAVPLTWRPFPHYRGVSELASIPACTGAGSAVLFLPFDRPSEQLGAQAFDDFRFGLARGLGYRRSSGEYGPLLLVDRPFLRTPSDLAAIDMAEAARQVRDLGVTCIVLPRSHADRSPAGVAAMTVIGGAEPTVAGDYLVWSRPASGWVG